MLRSQKPPLYPATGGSAPRPPFVIGANNSSLVSALLKWDLFQAKKLPLSSSAWRKKILIAHLKSIVQNFRKHFAKMRVTIQINTSKDVTGGSCLPQLNLLSKSYLKVTLQIFHINFVFHNCEVTPPSHICFPVRLLQCFISIWIHT